MIKTNEEIVMQQANVYNSYEKIKNNARYKKIWTFLKNRNSGGKLLDIGCSDGAFSAKLIKQGYDCYGLEATASAVKDSRSVGIKVSVGSFLEKFPYDESMFDVIFAGEVIEHTINDLAFLAEVKRVLKPGGVLILTTPNLVSLGNRFLMLVGKMPRFAYAEYHYKIYNRKILLDKIKLSGFNLLKLSSNYVIVSTYFNRVFGNIGEILGSIMPSWGENFIVYCEKS